MEKEKILKQKDRHEARNGYEIREKNVKETVTKKGNVRLTAEQLHGLSKEDLIVLVESERAYHQDRMGVLHKALQSVEQTAHSFGGFTFSPQDDPYAGLIDAIVELKRKVSEPSEHAEAAEELSFDEVEHTARSEDKGTNMRAILDHLVSSVFIIDKGYHLLDFNENFINGFCLQFNCRPDVGDMFPHVLEDERERTRWKARLDKTLAGKQGTYVDQMLTGEKSKVWEIRSYPVIGGGVVTGAIVLIGDITHLQDSELKLIEKNRDLARLNKEMDNFVYRISHDLRAPLTSIMGLINLIKLESDPDKLSKYIDLQEKSVKKLDRFIKDTINISRNARLAVSVEKINFRELVGEIFEHFDQEEGGEVVDKKLIIDENEPFYSDRQRLLVMLTNLISNGIKFRNSHQAVPHVHVYVTSDDKEVVIEVRDNGIGIATEYLNKIYSMFFRASKDDPGSGLGLYIVHEIINKLKGHMSVRSKLREGTTFTLKIPNLVKRYEAAPKLH